MPEKKKTIKKTEGLRSILPLVNSPETVTLNLGNGIILNIVVDMNNGIYGVLNDGGTAYLWHAEFDE